MTTPQDPGQPQYNPYGQPGSYRAGQQPGQYSSSPLPGQLPYTYSPYGSPPGAAYPAGLGQAPEAPASRPGIMVLGLVLMILAAVPFLFGGLVGLFAPLDASSIPPELLNDPQLVAAGATPELLISAVRFVAGVLLVVSLLYALFAVLAFRGRNWARIIVSVLSVGFVLLLAASLVSTASSGGLVGFIGFVVVAVAAGVVILFLPDSNRFFSAARRL